MCMLIYAGAVGVSAPDYFSDGLSPSLTKVNCTGTETDILDCQYDRIEDTCSSAGVVCQGVLKLCMHSFVRLCYMTMLKNL